MCRSAQKADNLKMLIAVVRSAIAKWKGEQAATPSRAKPMGAVFVTFRRALRFRE